MPQDTSAPGDLVHNLVANTAYLRAQQIDRNELRKQRLSLTLPRAKKSSALRAAVGKKYESLCEQQPIGKKLFQTFLRGSSPQYVAAAEFLEELSALRFADNEIRQKAKQSILAKFFRPESKFFLSYLTGENAKMCKDLTEKNFDDEVMEQMRDATRDFLKGKPFLEYQKSPFFSRFLQWKEYEKQNITDKYFYEFRTLGRGGFGEVCAVQVKHTGQMYACKKLDKRRLKKKSGERLALVEKQILEKVSSLFIVNLAYAYASKTHLCLVMDLMTGGDLKFHIYELGVRGICLERVVYYTAQITTGILHLHSMDIVYRDMKPENVLLDGKGQCRLSDLGLAVELPRGKMICQKAGTTGYMAPEVLKQEYYRTSVDWWALGCSIYEMIAARLPFKDFREKVQNEEVTRRTLEDECKYDIKRFDVPTKDIISRFLKKRVQHRLGCRSNDDPRSHVFFKSINFHRLEAGLVDPPWVPKPNVVYAKDTDDFRDTSELKDIQLDAKDEKFFREFSTGAVSIRWQKEIIESGVFDELNDAELNAENCENTWKSKMCIVL
ncbi:G protein-coupled receptor kinase 7B-like [Stegastes partitus]|uniref:G protein-coupled receptor kinase n=1 Tax=Stegastes partitus TaxID=144197 RepID=A0A3B5A9T9_9TELE|nr:PREDICTED: G protein-coupled receptor kinase 7B-like [Stegastes partitus]